MTRWRAPYGGIYFFVTNEILADFDYDYRSPIDATRFKSGNYFRIQEEAEAVAAQFRSILKQHHKDLELVTQ